jgi:hypothetical protein
VDGGTGRAVIYLLEVCHFHELVLIWEFELLQDDCRFPRIWPSGMGIEYDGLERRHVEIFFV